MCGIFGYSGSGADIEVLTACALSASQRGTDGHGFEALFSDGSQFSLRELGSMSKNARSLRHATGAELVIGHCRLSTGLDAGNKDAVHPFRSSRISLVHNGNYYDAAEVKRREKFFTSSECDSEVLLQLLLKYGESPQDAAELISRALTSSHAVLARYDKTLLIARRGLPIYLLQTRDGLYFSSVSFSSWCELLPETLLHTATGGVLIASPVSETERRSQFSWTH